MTLQEAIEWQYKNIPDTAIFVSFGVMCFLIVVICITDRDWRSITRRISACLLFEYLFLVLSFAIFFRTIGDEVKFNFELFWSYRAIADGRTEYLYENLLNIAMPIPVGLLLSIIIRPARLWKVMIAGISISVLIEVLQLVLHKGLCEFDDVMHNTIGCLVGYLLFLAILKTKAYINSHGSLYQSSKEA